MRKRWRAVVVVIALLSAIAWWFSAAPAPMERTEAVLEVGAPEPTPQVIDEAPVDASVVAPLAVDAPAADAGLVAAEDETDPRPLVSTYYLNTGNTMHDISGARNEFQIACNQEAEGCARRFQRSGIAELPVLMTIGGEPGSRRVVGYSSAMEIMGGPTPFSDCLLAGMSTHTFVDPQMVGDHYSCSLVDFREEHNPERELVRAAAKCVGPDSKAEVVSITRRLRRVGGSLINEVPVISALGRLDLSAEACLRQAAQSWPLRPESPSSQTPRAHTLQLVLADEIGGHIPEEDADRLSATERRTTPRVAPSDEALAAAKEQLKQAEVAMSSGNAKEAVRLLRACFAVDPDNLDCLRASSFAWLEYLRQNPGKTSVRAAEIWVHFVVDAPPDDPDLPKVNAALARMGVHLR